jgi:threonine dehydrogenase-like Zn-dependent dehydrogenase
MQFFQALSEPTVCNCRHSGCFKLQLLCCFKLSFRAHNVPDPSLIEADDILRKVTATAICGSDRHLFRGKVPGMKSGDIMGHEFMGEVVDAGAGVTAVKKGDRVVIPFTIACGHCFFCEKDLYGAYENTNDGRGAILNKKGVKPGAGLFGYTHLYGGYAGGQAEYVRVPKANVGPFKIPEGLSDEQVLFLSDILPTGYQAILNGKLEKGGTVAIFGAGPVGMMAAACAKLIGRKDFHGRSPRVSAGVRARTFRRDSDQLRRSRRSR